MQVCISSLVTSFSFSVAAKIIGIRCFSVSPFPNIHCYVSFSLSSSLSKSASIDLILSCSSSQRLALLASFAAAKAINKSQTSCLDSFNVIVLWFLNILFPLTLYLSSSKNLLAASKIPTRIPGNVNVKNSPKYCIQLPLFKNSKFRCSY